MTRLPLISVLLPCRDASEFLPDCIASLQTQSYANLEIIAVDDHSTDGTAQALADWATRNPAVRVMKASAPGIVPALNKGLSGAAGHYIARMDADDIAHPGRILQQFRAFESDPALVACGTRVRYFPRAQVRDGARRYEAWLNALIEPEQLARDRFVECPIAHPALMVRTEAMRALGGYRDRGWPEDYDLVLRLFNSGARMRNVPKVLLQWRDRPDRLSRTDVRYSEAAFTACKVHHLLEDRPGLNRVIICGAGPVGKAFGKEFLARGVGIQAFIDIDPRKIGQTIHGAQVLAPSELSAARNGTFVISAVSGELPRAEIRARLTAMNLADLIDFVAVA